LQNSATFGIGRNPYCGGHRTGYLIWSFKIVEQCIYSPSNMTFFNNIVT
jgi:hypothetical protein